MLVNKTTGLKSTHMDSFIHSFIPNKRMDTFPLLLLKYCIIYFLLIPKSYVSTAFLCVPVQTYFLQVLEQFFPGREGIYSPGLLDPLMNPKRFFESLITDCQLGLHIFLQDSSLLQYRSNKLI
jgi:hypothetical protein